jgi:hypothetical protein
MARQRNSSLQMRWFGGQVVGGMQHAAAASDDDDDDDDNDDDRLIISSPKCMTAARGTLRPAAHAPRAHAGGSWRLSVWRGGVNKLYLLDIGLNKHKLSVFGA